MKAHLSLLNFECIYPAQSQLKFRKLQPIDETGTVFSEIHQIFIVYLQNIYLKISVSVLT